MQLLSPPLRRRDFRPLWLAGFISMTGAWLLLMGLPLPVYCSSGSILATGLLFVVTTLPEVFLSPLVRALVDRWGRQQTLLAANGLLTLAGGLALLVPRAPRGLPEEESATASASYTEEALSDWQLPGCLI